MLRFLALLVFVLASLSPAPAQASKGCWCWIGIERGERLIDFGSVARFRDLESGKKRKCSEACSKRCASDLANPAKLCQKIGKDFNNSSKIGCFSVVGHKDSKNNTWDYDGRPRPFQCSSCCTCERGWYDKNRRSCVEGTGCAVPGMPNGSKGGGYFAWDQKLFRNIPGARCQTVVGGCPTDQDLMWTPWLDRDNPGGQGDYETLSHFIAAGQACAAPAKIECRTRSGIPWEKAGQVYRCEPNVGGVCVNSQQKGGARCQDYEVRFLCPK